MWPSNPAVNLETRRFLRRLAAEDSRLDLPCLELLERALAKSSPVSPAGLVFLLADALGAALQTALEVASFAELFYATCSYTDDVQDGDGAGIAEGLSAPMQVNVAAQLLCVTVVRGAELERRLGPDVALRELGATFLTGTGMLTGQRLELLREDWSVATWRRVAELSAGDQFAAYLRLAAAAAGVDPAPLLPLAAPLGILAQLEQDVRTGDPRLTCLPRQQVEELARDAAQQLRAAARAVPGAAQKLIASVVERACQAADSAGERGNG
jgi:histone H3/H4